MRVHERVDAAVGPNHDGHPHPRRPAHRGQHEGHQLASGLNTLADEPNEYNGQITIEIRGSSSQFFPKQSYALETQDSTGANNNVPLMGMPAENDWILHGPYSDKTLMRNAVIYEMGTAIGQYTTRRRYCELYINGDYRGVYMFMENIKRDDNRVDIATLLPTDTAGNEVTGGYIMKVDRIQGDYEGGWNSPTPSWAAKSSIQMHKPEADDLHPLQLDYIENHFTAFEHALAGPNFTDPVLGYAPLHRRPVVHPDVLRQRDHQERGRLPFEPIFLQREGQRRRQNCDGAVVGFQLGLWQFRRLRQLQHGRV